MAHLQLVRVARDRNGPAAAASLPTPNSRLLVQTAQACCTLFTGNMFWGVEFFWGHDAAHRKIHNWDWNAPK